MFCFSVPDAGKVLAFPPSNASFRPKRADALLGLVCRKLLGIGRKVWLLSSEEDEYMPLRRELVFHALEPLRVLYIVHLMRSILLI
jgi:hypothetical protein